MELKDFTNEYERKEITKFLKNTALVNIVKKVLLKDIYESGTLKAGVDPDPRFNFALSLLHEPTSGMEYKVTNTELGEKLRACIEGIRFVEAGFASLEKMKEEDKPKEESKDNPAR